MALEILIKTGQVVRISESLAVAQNCFNSAGAMMGISQMPEQKTLSQAEATTIAQWLERCGLSLERTSTEQLQRCVPGQNLFEKILFGEDSDLRWGRLSFGLPHPNFSQHHSANHLFWFPTELPRGRSVCVASSRLGRKLDTYDSWFDAIRTMAARLNPDDHFLITGAGTTADLFLRRVGQLFGFEVVEFRPFPAQVSRKWLQESLLAATRQEENDHRHSVCYFGDLAEVLKTDNLRRRTPIDQCLVQIASEVLLLSVRANGNIWQAAQQRLARNPSGKTRLLVDARLTANSLKEKLIAQGATAWWLYDDPMNLAPAIEPLNLSNPNCSHRLEIETPLLDIAEVKPDQFLLHWTRRRIGPWPDQTDQEYLDDLIFRSQRRNHEVISTLGRILATRRILATSQLTRGTEPVACFSNIPLNEIQQRKIFRKHLGRWDCEPIGIAIDRDRLMELGARPVIYGDEESWRGLEERERAFFQIARTRNHEVDWREEKEWRLIGDLDLNLIDANSAVVFVPTTSEAKRIAKISRWPIVVLAG